MLVATEGQCALKRYYILKFLTFPIYAHFSAQTMSGIWIGHMAIYIVTADPI